MAFQMDREDHSERHIDIPFSKNEKAYRARHDLLASTHDQLYTLQEEHVLIPLSVFSKGGSTLRLLVRYLKDAQNMSFHEISLRLRRSYIAIYTTYRASKPMTVRPEASAILIPLSVFSSRTKSPLESLVDHLSRLALCQSEISRLIRKDPRTIWTIQSRISKKKIAHQEGAS